MDAQVFSPAQELARSQQSRTEELRIIYIALIPSSVAAVFLRLLSRRVARMKIWWDDFLCMAALIFAVGLNVALLLGTYHGMGEHAEFAGRQGMMYNGKVEFAGELIYMGAMSSIKISILLFYYRLFKSNQRFQIAVWVMSTVTICWYLTSCLVAIFQCFPVAYNWNRSIPGGRCIPVDALWIGNSVSSLITDVLILCLPIPIIWSMGVTRRQKCAILGMFLLGALVCVTSILRLFTIHELGDSDPTYTNVASAIWTSVECSTAVICACLPTYKPLFRCLSGSRGIRRDSITSLTPLSMTEAGTANPRRTSDLPRKMSDFSVTSPKQPQLEQFRIAANEKRIDNLDITPFQDDIYSPGTGGNAGGLYIGGIVGPSAAGYSARNSGRYPKANSGGNPGGNLGGRSEGYLGANLGGNGMGRRQESWPISQYRESVYSSNGNDDRVSTVSGVIPTMPTKNSWQHYSLPGVEEVKLPVSPYESVTASKVFGHEWERHSS